MIDFELNGQTLKISSFDEKGDIKFTDIHLPANELYTWKKVNEGTNTKFRTVWDEPIQKRNSRYLTNYRINDILHRLPQEKKDIIFDNNKPKLFSVDIEVEVGEGFSSAETAERPILTIAFSYENMAWAVGTKPLSEAQKASIKKRLDEHFQTFGIEFKFGYTYYQSESLMLRDFFDRFIPKMPAITGWYFLNFDWTYLVNRCRLLGIDPAVSSPTRKMDKTISKNKHNKDNKEIELPMHRLVFDYKEVWEKWDRTIKVKESSSLDVVSETVLEGVNKVKFSGNFQQLYEQDFETYVFYNCVDSILVTLIHKKLKTFDTHLMLAKEGMVRVKDAFSPSKMIECILAEDYMRKGQMFIKDKERVHQNYEQGTYTGGYVKEPNKGIYDNVAIFDYSSLFPSIIRQYNISPDVFLGQKVSETHFEDDEGNVHPITDQMITTSSGGVFDKTKDGILKTKIEDLYEKRLSQKYKEKQLALEIDWLKKQAENA